MSCSISIYVPRTSRRTATGPKTVPCSVSVYVLRTPRWPNRTVTGPKTVPRSVPVHARTSRRPKPSKPGPTPCRALGQLRHKRRAGPTRSGAGPKTVPCSVSFYFPRPSPRAKPESPPPPPSAFSMWQNLMVALPALCRAIQITASQSDNVPFLQKEKYTERSSDLLYMSKKMATS